MRVPTVGADNENLRVRWADADDRHVAVGDRRSDNVISDNPVVTLADHAYFTADPLRVEPVDNSQLVCVRQPLMVHDLRNTPAKTDLILLCALVRASSARG